MEKRIEFRSQDYKNWIENIKESDKVAIVTDPNDPSTGECRIARVDRKNQKWMACGGCQFLYSGESRTGTAFLLPVTKDICQEVCRREILAELRCPSFDHCSLEQWFKSLLRAANKVADILQRERAICPRCGQFVTAKRSCVLGAAWKSYSCGHVEVEPAAVRLVA